MSSPGVLYLMYHELELPGREICRPKDGYARYVVSEENFRSQLAAIHHAGLRGVSVGESLRMRNADSSAVVLTFDDGCETDWIAAAPALRDVGFQATFYLVVGFLERRGHLSKQQARELAEAGFEVGCHSMTHPYLTDLTPSELQHEIVHAKNELERVLGKGVEHFSCPGGRWDPHVAEVAKEAGYHSVATSLIGTNSPSSNPYKLNRVAVLRGMEDARFNRLCRGEGLLVLRTRQAVLSVGKRALGNVLYEKIHDHISRDE
jgi:peptidoglycan/xylan/chitin deacetylase (PgdA/CDA1 family)